MSLDDVHKCIDTLTTDFSAAEINGAAVAFSLVLGLPPFRPNFDWFVVRRAVALSEQRVRRSSMSCAALLDLHRDAIRAAFQPFHRGYVECWIASFG